MRIHTRPFGFTSNLQPDPERTLWDQIWPQECGGYQSLSYFGGRRVLNDKPKKHWEKIINYKKATIYLMKKTKPQILILITMAFIVCSCESILEVANNAENPLTEEPGLDRSNCISCSPTISNQTLEKPSPERKIL